MIDFTDAFILPRTDNELCEYLLKKINLKDTLSLVYKSTLNITVVPFTVHFACTVNS